MNWFNQLSVFEYVSIAIFIIAYLIYTFRVLRLSRFLGNIQGSIIPKLVIRGAFFTLIIIALLGPSFGNDSKEVKSIGKDIMIAIDLSNSMNAVDIQPSRLEKIKYELNNIIKEFNSDRIGLIIFSSEAFVQCPLTYDQSALNLFIETLSSRLVPNTGTDFGPPLSLALEKLDTDESAIDSKAKIIILISDGEDFGDETSTVRAEIRDKGIKLFTLGVGTTQGSKIIMPDGVKKDQDGNEVVSKLNRQSLKELAARTGGSYFEINQRKIIVTNGDSMKEYDRSKLVSFITGGEEELDYWTAKITLGLNVRSGNTDQVDYNAKANIRRQTSFSRMILDYIGNISNTQDVETANNHRVTGTQDILRSRRFFFRPIFGEYYSDPFSNIDSRVTVGTGVGYTIIDTKRTEWTIAGGPAYQATRFVSVQEGENIKETTPALVIGTDYDIELTKKLDFIFNYNVTWGNTASGGYTHHMVTTFESEIIGSFDFDISFIWDHISSPTEAEDGITPLPDDYRMTVGISYEY